MDLGYKVEMIRASKAFLLDPRIPKETEESWRKEEPRRGRGKFQQKKAKVALKLNWELLMVVV